MIKQSDLVCRGTVRSSEILHRQVQNTSEQTFEAHIDFCYAGTSPDAFIAVSQPRVLAPNLAAKVQNGDSLLLFLKRSGGIISCLNAHDAVFRISPHVQNTKQPQPGDILKVLETDLEAGLSDSDPELVISSLQLLAGLRDLQQPELIDKLTESMNTQVRGTALLALMKLGRYSKLQESIDYLNLNLSGWENSLIQRPMRTEFEQINGASGVLSILEHNVNAKTFLARSSVAKAMRQMKRPESVPYLIILLDDPNQEIRYDAVIALAMIEHKSQWGPAIYIYQRNEGKFIQSWKQWWEAEGKGRYAPAPE